tara:strand:+ start:95 stop:1297 length:1203 start_codon:yes stop_codon:yes gene_type:complete
MSISIEQTNFLKLDSKGIVSFTLKSSQPTMDDIVIPPSRDTIDISKPINFYFSSSNIHNKFKDDMINAPVTPTLICMNDFHGNNVGKYPTERKSNNGGNIRLVTEKTTFLNEISVSDNSVIFLEDYYPIGKFTSELAKNFLLKDAEMCGDKFKNTIVYMHSKLYKELIVLNSVDFRKIFKQIVIVLDTESLVQTSIEHIFGRVITGKPPYVSTFLQVLGGKLSNIVVNNTNCTISHRSTNRIQFVTNSSEAEATIICFIDDFPETVCIEMDDRWKAEDFAGEVTTPLDVSITPLLELDFYQNLFSLKEIIHSLTKDNFNERCIANSELVVFIMLNRFEFDNKSMNDLEKMLIGNYNSEISKFSERFYTHMSPSKNQHRLHQKTSFHTPSLLRETTCATSF